MDCKYPILLLLLRTLLLGRMLSQDLVQTLPLHALVKVEAMRQLVQLLLVHCSELLGKLIAHRS